QADRLSRSANVGDCELLWLLQELAGGPLSGAARRIPSARRAGVARWKRQAPGRQRRVSSRNVRWLRVESIPATKFAPGRSAATSAWLAQELAARCLRIS